MLERLSDRARKAMHLANSEARRLNHDFVGTEHLLLGIVAEGSGVGACVLKGLGAELTNVRAEVERHIAPGKCADAAAKLPYTPAAKKAIEYAIEECRYLHHGYVGTEHLLLGLLRESEGIARRVLQSLGVSLNAARHKTGKIGRKVEVEPIPMPTTLKVVKLDAPGMACLVDNAGNPIGTEMQIEIAKEIAKRYNRGGA